MRVEGEVAGSAQFHDATILTLLMWLLRLGDIAPCLQGCGNGCCEAPNFPLEPCESWPCLEAMQAGNTISAINAFSAVFNVALTRLGGAELHCGDGSITIDEG